MSVTVRDDGRAIKVALNDSAFRSSSEWLLGSVSSHRLQKTRPVSFVCECADQCCREIVMLGIDEYQRIRSHPTWFLLAAGHEDPEASYERILEAERGYAIVERVGTASGKASRRRRRQGTTA